MRRREFIKLLGGAGVAWPHAARSQQSQRLPRVGVLVGGGGDQWQAPMAAFRKTLQNQGWTIGQNIEIDYRVVVTPSELDPTVADLLALAPDVMLINNTPAVLAVRQKTQTMPIVFVILTDPVGSGIVGSLARPGGNVTGFTNFEFSTSGKWLELLKEIAPHLKRVALIFNPMRSPQTRGYIAALRTSADLLGVELLSSGAADAAEIERLVSDIAQRPGGGLITLPDIFTGIHREYIIALAARNRVPAVYQYRFFTAAGGLLSYGVDITEQFRQGASYVHRVLRGDKTADLPVQQPTKFELVINLKTAKALGITVPPSLLARADEVIE